MRRVLGVLALFWRRDGYVALAQPTCVRRACEQVSGRKGTKADGLCAACACVCMFSVWVWVGVFLGGVQRPRVQQLVDADDDTAPFFGDAAAARRQPGLVPKKVGPGDKGEVRLGGTPVNATTRVDWTHAAHRPSGLDPARVRAPDHRCRGW